MRGEGKFKGIKKMLIMINIKKNIYFCHQIGNDVH